ncbi:MAG TPA: glycosyltransferase family 4 protein, partial [Prolixibacteraceae bacterium]|nr:glycosyltransferase family 4 protein [Prolixibacteraceae bacterium]
KEKYIFTEGSLKDDSKNLQIILDTAPQIRYPIYIAGNNDESELKHLPVNVFFTGPLTPEERKSWLSKAFIYLLPARYEPFGYTFIDAAFSKCALIGGNISSLREIWQEAMIYIRSEEELVYEINDLMENPEELYIWGQKAFEKSHENYRLEKMIKRYYQLYTKVQAYESA